MKNLFVSHAGDSLITVVQNHNRYKLLADFDQTNVILHEIKAGSSVWLTPDPKFPRYMEYYTLLEGELILHCGEEGDTHLSAGDSFYTTGLECDVSISPADRPQAALLLLKAPFQRLYGVCQRPERSQRAD